jgi:hypothetical protein
MNPILAALQAYLEQVVKGVAEAAADFLVNWFKNHVLPKETHLQALAPTELRAQARQWVHDMLTEFGQALVTKGVVPVWAQGFLPSVENLVEQAIDKALDAAGL